MILVKWKFFLISFFFFFSIYNCAITLEPRDSFVMLEESFTPEFNNLNQVDFWSYKILSEDSGDIIVVFKGLNRFIKTKKYKIEKKLLNENGEWNVRLWIMAERSGSWGRRDQYQSIHLYWLFNLAFAIPTFGISIIVMSLDIISLPIRLISFENNIRKDVEFKESQNRTIDYTVQCGLNEYKIQENQIRIPINHLKNKSLYPSCNLLDEKKIPVFFFTLNIPALAKDDKLSENYSLQMKKVFLKTISSFCKDSLEIEYLPPAIRQKLNEIGKAFPKKDPLYIPLNDKIKKLDNDSFYSENGGYRNLRSLYKFVTK